MYTVRRSWAPTARAFDVCNMQVCLCSAVFRWFKVACTFLVVYFLLRTVEELFEGYPRNRLQQFFARRLPKGEPFNTSDDWQPAIAYEQRARNHGLSVIPSKARSPVACALREDKLNARPAKKIYYGLLFNHELHILDILFHEIYEAVRSIIFVSA